MTGPGMTSSNAVPFGAGRVGGHDGRAVVDYPEQTLADLAGIEPSICSGSVTMTCLPPTVLDSCPQRKP
jgi:hypothetical protein